MHDHEQSERDRQAYELREGYAAKRRLKYVNRFVEYVASSSANTDALRQWAAQIALGETVIVGGVGVFSPEHGFLCEGCNRAAGPHNCFGKQRSRPWRNWDLLDCDCSVLDCGAARFKRDCERPREVKDKMVW